MTHSELQALSIRAESTSSRFARAVSVAAAVYVIVGGIVTLMGWAFDLRRLTDWNDDRISMFPNTAVCAALGGVVLLLNAFGSESKSRRNTARFLASLVALIGALTLSQHMLEINLGIDTLLSDKTWGQNASTAPMRMGPPASTSFLILGSAMLLTTLGSESRRFAGELAMLVVAIASLSLIGYWFGADQLFGVAQTTGIAWQTSTMLAALSIGVMASVPEHGIVAALRRNDAGGTVLRRLVVPIVVVPLVLGWLRVFGQQAELYDLAFGTAVRTLVEIMLLFGLLWWTANGISEQARAARMALQEQRESELRFRIMADAAPVLMWMSDLEKLRTWFNKRWLEFVGRPLERERDHGWAENVHPEDVERCMADYHSAFDAQEDFLMEYRLKRHDGVYRWVLDNGIPRYDSNGRFTGYIGSCVDITERREAEEAAKQADRRKDEFLAMLGHELRNPLAPIGNALQLIEHATSDPDMLRQTLDTMQRQFSKMVRLVDDLLDVGRITRDKLELRNVRTELEPLILQAVETTRALPEGAGHDLRVELPPEPIWLDADPVRLSQVFGNLLTNACKFTERGGRIVISAERDGREAVVRVKDPGIGIAPDKQEAIFEMFEQLDKSLERSRGGLGIGLTLVKRLVELHQGSITARSDGPGRGSEFIVRLPILVEAVVPATTRPPSSDGVVASKSRRILVTDDNRDAANSLAMLLKLSGHEVDTAYDGNEAVQKAAARRPDVILLDIGLPGKNGYEVCRTIRQEPWGKGIQIVAVTGWGQEQDRRNTREAGFDHHLVKPVTTSALDAALASAT